MGKEAGVWEWYLDFRFPLFVVLILRKSLLRQREIY
jgi:hypothetical protein